MPTFKQISENWLKHNSAQRIDVQLVYSQIGDINIECITSAELQNFFSYLYDEVKHRGVAFTSYEKFIGDVFQYAYENGYVSSIPIIEHRSPINPNLFNKPNSSAMQLLISHEDCTPAGTILRLAWYCGLLRNEITFLLWNQVDFSGKQIILPDRKVPLSEEMVTYLECLNKQNAQYSEYVLVSNRKTAPLTEQRVSAIARKSLDDYRQNGVRLNDLRVDYIVRTLKEHDKKYVSYISGVDMQAINLHYMPYVGEDLKSTDKKAEITECSRDALKAFIEKEGASMVGLSMRFVWQMGIPVAMLPQLTWGAINFKTATAVFRDRTVDIPDDFIQILKEVKISRNEEHDTIILNDNKQKTTDHYFIQKTVHQALMRAGIIGVTLPALLDDYWRNHYAELKELLNENNASEISSEIYSIPKNFKSDIVKPSEDELIEYLNNNISADKKTLRSALKLTDNDVNRLIVDCQNEGKLVRVGFRYFLTNTIIQRDKQREVILEFVKKNQPVTNDQIMELLGLSNRKQVYWVLNPLIQSGELIRVRRNRYSVPSYNEVLVLA